MLFLVSLVLLSRDFSAFEQDIPLCHPFAAFRSCATPKPLGKGGLHLPFALGSGRPSGSEDDLCVSALRRIRRGGKLFSLLPAATSQPGERYEGSPILLRASVNSVVNPKNTGGYGTVYGITAKHLPLLDRPVYKAAGRSPQTLDILVLSLPQRWSTKAAGTLAATG
jgi:hypothetical protein